MTINPTFVPRDGRLTSLEAFTGAVDPTAVMEIVSPGTEAEGNNYKITLQVLGTYFSTFVNITVLEVGGTVSAPYNVAPSDGRVLVNKTVGSASYLVFPLAEDMDSEGGVLIKDLKGDADANPITISFTDGELCDGLAEIVLSNPYAWTTINPVPGGGAWYLS